ncbi:hypothetical protein ElyMa_000369700 [Elysia marginata]|uniref:Uncharacterized protein n=1 Tax=Elysia marginata TaxID=1093978 RepID=A0AAV4FFB8_9GAST|nr:hypothetical protein ElyMa_000369700 [Elysia marginata]
MCNEAKEEWINGQCKEIEDCKKADNAYMHQKINDIASKKRTAQGHIYRARGIEHLAMTGKINGKKSCGRQRTTYVDSLNTWANLEQHTRSQFMRSPCERQIWKTMTVNACSRHGT